MMAMLLCVVMLFSMLPTNIFAAEAEKGTEEATQASQTQDEKSNEGEAEDDKSEAEDKASGDDDKAEEEEESGPVYYCGKEEHKHSDDCYEEFHVLVNPLDEGDDKEAEYVDFKTRTCGLEKHTHNDNCLDPDYKEPEQEPVEEKTTYCGLEEHFHSYECLDKLYYKDQIICGHEDDEDHVHTEDCYAFDWIFACMMEEHKHVDECYIDPNAVEEEEEEDANKQLDEQPAEAEETKGDPEPEPKDDPKPEQEPAEPEKEPEKEPESEQEDAEKGKDSTPPGPMDIEEYAELPVGDDADEDYLDNAQLTNSTLKAAKNIQAMAPKGGSLRGDPVQEPVSGDGVTIERLTVKWLSKSTGESERAGYGTLVLVPEDDKMPNQQWQIDLSLSGKGNIDAGELELVIPAYIWKDRNGKEPGLLTMAIPQEPDVSGDFAWKRVGDTIVITNTHSISAAANYYVQGTFRMTYPDPNADRPFDTTYAHDMVDKDIVDPTSVSGSGVSNDFFAIVNLTTPNEKQLLTMTSNSIGATVDTYARAMSATKEIVDGKIFFRTPEKIPAALLARLDNADNYFFAQWYVDGAAEGNQPFIVTTTDTVSSTAYKVEDDESRTPIEVHGIMLGASGTYEGNVVSADGKTVTAKLFEGYTDVAKSGYIWVAYPKSDFPVEGAVYELENTQTITVTSSDDRESSTKDATGKVMFRKPIVWKIDKVWDDNNNEKGRRPESIKVWIENTSRPGYNTSSGYQKVAEFILSDENNWHAEWEDDGSLSTYEAYEVSYNVSRGQNFGVGSSERVQLDDGTSYTFKWWYKLIHKEFDGVAHTWTFTNKYNEDVIWAGISLFDKRTSGHGDSRLMSTGDKDVLLLSKGMETSEIAFAVSSSTFTLPDTIAEGALTSDVSQYEQRTVTVEMTDTSMVLNNRTLTTDDYRISRVRLYQPEVSGWQPNLDATIKPITDRAGIGEFTDHDSVPVELYGLTGAGWIKYAEMDASGAIETFEGATSGNGDVYLPAGVKQIKTISKVSAARISTDFMMWVVLLPSEANVNYAKSLFETSDYVMTNLYNYASMRYIDSEDTVVRQRQDSDVAYLHGRNYKIAAHMLKTSEFVENNVSTRQLRFTHTLTLLQQSNIDGRSDYDFAREQRDIPYSKEGTFYDLLPAGMTLVENSVKINRGSIQTIDTIQDYKGSGCTLVIIKAKLGSKATYKDINSTTYGQNWPTSGFGETNIVTFDTMYSYEEAQNRGIEGMRNHAAYEAAEADFGNITGWVGEADAPSGTNHSKSASAIREDVAAYFNNLDETRDDPVFVYAGANIVVTELDFSALTDLRMHAQVQGADAWNYGHDNEVTVSEGGRYNYRVQMTSGVDMETSEIIMIHPLESYIPVEGDADYIEGETAWTWQGKFLGLDVSEVRAMGVDPVVYYTTKTDLDVSGYNPDRQSGIVAAILENGTDGWSTTPPEDMSTVTAWAIDCRKDKDGNDFKLAEGEALLIYVSMLAPTADENPSIFSDGDYTSPLNNAHAFSNVYMDVAQKNQLSLVGHTYDDFCYTKVGIVGSDLNVNVVWDDMNNNDGIRPESILVSLYADGVDTGKTVELTASENWENIFSHVPQYNSEGKAIAYTLVTDDAEGYEITSEKQGDTLVVTGKHEPERISVPFTKTWTSDEPSGWESKIPASVEFRLLVDGKFTGVKKNLRGSGVEWSGSFDDVLKYKNGQEIVYSVVETQVNDFVTTYDGNAVTNKYYPYGNLSVTTNIQQGTPAALENEFEFTLSLKNADGSAHMHQYSYTVYDDEDNEISSGEIGNGGTFTLKDGWRIDIPDIASGTKYEIKESPKSGFTLSSQSGTSGKIVSGETKTAVFENTYFSNCAVGLSLTKTLTGSEMKKYQFSFILENALTGAIVRTVSNQADGSARFGDLRFTNADDGVEFFYRVTEMDRGKPGYTYDDMVYVVRIVPHDNGDSTMACDVDFFRPLRDGEEAPAEGLVSSENDLINGLIKVDGIEFVNAYHASGSLVLRGWKVLSGRDLVDDEFDFELLNADGAILQTTKNVADGSVVFEAIEYNETDIGKTYYYAIREKAGTDPTVVYDDSVFGYSVLVVDNKDGTLSFTQNTVDMRNAFLADTACNGTGIAEATGDACSECGGSGLVKNPDWEPAEGELPVFRNSLNPGNLSITKQVTSDPGIDVDPDQEFHFKVRLIGPDIQDGEISFDLAQAADVGEDDDLLMFETEFNILQTLEQGNDQRPNDTHTYSITIDPEISAEIQDVTYEDGTPLMRDGDGWKITILGYSSDAICIKCQFIMSRAALDAMFGSDDYIPVPTGAGLFHLLKIKTSGKLQSGMTVDQDEYMLMYDVGTQDNEYFVQGCVKNEYGHAEGYAEFEYQVETIPGGDDPRPTP